MSFKGVLKSQPVTEEKWESWLKIDDNIPTRETLTQEQIVGNVKAVMDLGGDANERDEVDNGDDNKDLLTYSQIRDAMAVVKQALVQELT